LEKKPALHYHSTESRFQLNGLESVELTIASEHFLAPNYVLNVLVNFGQFIKEICIIMYKKVQLSPSMQLRHIGGAEVDPCILKLMAWLLRPPRDGPSTN
jgi:hypothetical protein